MNRTLLLTAAILLLLSPVFARTYYPYWIEPGSDGSPAKVWVKVPSIPANGSTVIYVWKEMGHVPDGSAVFDFYDDFSTDTTANYAKYGTVTWNSAGYITLTADYAYTSGYYWGIFGYDVQRNTNFVVMARVRPNSCRMELLVREYDSSGSSPIYGHGISFRDTDSANVYLSDEWVGFPASAAFSWTYGQWYTIETVAGQTTTDAAACVYNSNSKVCIPMTSMTRREYTNIAFFAYRGNAGGTCTADLDWWAVRKYAPTEPSVSVQDKGGYYEVTVQNPNSTDLTDFQVSFSASDVGVTSTSESIAISDASPSGLSVNVSYTPTEVHDLALDPEANVTSVTVTYTATITTFNTTPTYLRIYDADTNATIYETTTPNTETIQERYYTAVGDYNTCVYVQAVDDTNTTYEDTACDVVHIDEYPQGLTITWDMNGLKIPFPGENITFVGSATDNGTLSYSWDFGDGNTATGQNTTHAYGSAGTYTVTLTVTDDVGLNKSTTASVPVYAVPTIEGNTSLLEHHYYTYTFTVDNRLDANVSVMWGDGSSASTSGNTVLAHSWAPGTYTIGATYTLSDGTTTREHNASLHVTVADITYSTSTSACSTATLLTLTSQDETNTATSLSPTYTVYFQATYPDGATEEYSAQQGGSAVYVCASASSDQTFISGELSASLDGYSTRAYFFDVNGTNATQSLTTYLAPATKVAPITVTVLSESGTPVSAGYKVIATRYYPDVSGYVAIAGGKTDVTGQTAMYLIPYEVYYRFRIIDPDGKVTEYPPQLVTSSTVSLQISGVATTTDYAVLLNTVATCWYAEDANVVKCSWTNRTGTDVSVKMEVKRKTAGPYYQTVWSQHVQTSSGLLAYDVNEDGVYVAELLLLDSGGGVTGKLASVAFSKGKILHKDLAVASAITVTAAGFAGSTVSGGLIGILFALLAADVFGIPIPVALFALIGIIIIMNRRAVE